MNKLTYDKPDINKFYIPSTNINTKLKKAIKSRVVQDGKKSMIRKYTNFSQIVNLDNSNLVNIKNQILEKLKYIQIFKENTGSSIDEVFTKDPKFQYLRSCIADVDLALPILEKVVGTTLCLQSYTLNQSHCNALAKACVLFDTSIRRVLFDNCGIDDSEFAAILEGIQQLKDFKSIIYKRNIIDEKSL